MLKNKLEVYPYKHFLGVRLYINNTVSAQFLIELRSWENEKLLPCKGFSLD